MDFVASYRLTLSYRGTNYAGWQRQTNACTVQQVVEDALADLCGEKVTVIGAGRTDAGVHARGQVVHFTLSRPLPDRALVGGVNQRLPQDVRVMAAARVPAEFHARKSALAKEYRYRLVRARIVSPLDALFAVAASPEIDVELLRRAAAQLVGEHDFTAFALAGGSHRSARREIYDARWTELDDDLWFSIRGSGFLRGMVRSIVGTLLEVGGGRRPLEGFGALLAGAKRSSAGPTAPAHGLVLWSVDYPQRLFRVEDQGHRTVVF